MYTTIQNAKRQRCRWFPGLFVYLLATFAVPALAQDRQPEDGTGRQQHGLTQAERHMVAAAHPQAVAAGLETLRAGGTAADAAVAFTVAPTRR